MKSGPVPPTGATARWIGASSSISDGPLKVREGLTLRIADRDRATVGRSRGKKVYTTLRLTDLATERRIRTTPILQVTVSPAVGINQERAVR